MSIKWCQSQWKRCHQDRSAFPHQLDCGGWELKDQLLKVRTGLSKDNNVFFIRAAVPPQGESDVLGQPEPPKGYSPALPPISPGRSRGRGGGRFCPGRRLTRLLAPNGFSPPLGACSSRGGSASGAHAGPRPRFSAGLKHVLRGERPAGLAATLGAPGLGGEGDPQANAFPPERRFLGVTSWYKGVRGPVLPLGLFAGACLAAPSHRHTKHPCPALPPSLPAPRGRPCPQPALPAACPAAGPAAPREARVKGLKSRAGTEPSFSPGQHHKPKLSTERFKLPFQSPAPGKAKRYPAPPRRLAATLPPRLGELIGTSPPVSCARRCNTPPVLLAPPNGRCARHTVPRAHAGRERGRERSGGFRSDRVGRTCVPVTAGRGQGAGTAPCLGSTCLGV